MPLRASFVSVQHMIPGQDELIPAQRRCGIRLSPKSSMVTRNGGENFRGLFRIRIFTRRITRPGESMI
jgi:hypothetical protein